MYYYGYSGGYGYNNPCCNYSYPQYGNSNGYGASIILVLFILLVIVIGAGFFNRNN
jgi:hypothetical protein